MSQAIETTEVLTLEEAAAFLRVSPDAVMRSVVQQALPGRQIEGQWRFLRTALADWLREKSGKAVLLSQAGVLALIDTTDLPLPSHSVMDIEPVSVGALLQPLGRDDDLLGEMLEGRR